MTRRKTDAELTAEIERDIESGEFFEGLKPVENVATKPPRVVHSLRLSAQEYLDFDAAAQARGMSLSDFLRAAAYASIEGDRDKALHAVRVKAKELTEALNRL
jgi:hypothetical protein